MDESMWRVMNWLQHLDEDATLAYIEAILRWTKNRRAFDAWTGFVATERRLKGNIRATIEAALLSYQSEAVEHNSRHCDIVPERLFNGGANTLYVCAPMAEQSRLEPVFVALIQGLLFWITEQPEPQRMPVLVVLDEAANIAALSELPSLISTIGGHNVQLITCWQDFAQMRARYGDQSQSIINNSRAKLVLRGVSDPETIRIFAAMTGEMIESQDSVSVSDSGGKHRSFGETRRSILTPAVIRQQKQGEAILVYGHMPPAKIKLRLWFKDNELRELAGDSPLSVSGPRAQLDRLVQTLPRLPRPVASLRRAVQGVFSRRW
jgi:type IV secretory pathway TraG/TraD family ATPase VirD4